MSDAADKNIKKIKKKIHWPEEAISHAGTVTAAALPRSGNSPVGAVTVRKKNKNENFRDILFILSLFPRCVLLLCVFFLMMNKLLLLQRCAFGS